MRLADVKTVIEGVDPDATYRAFQAETGTAEPEKFLSYLKDKALVSQSDFVALHADDAIEVTVVVSQPGARPASGASAAPAGAAEGAPPPRPPSHYELLGTVGRGGMGLVYVARDLDLRRKVALKQLAPGMTEQEDAVARFVKEVQITAQLEHPHIVPVYGLEGGRGGEIAYAMKLVQGKTFADLVDEAREALAKGGPLDEAHALPARLEHFVKVCDAVAYAHGKGVLHRDLKPANLMIGKYNEVYVMDWGLARLIGRREAAEPGVDLASVPEAADSRVVETRLGTVIGTPRYMSPEQVTQPSDTLDGRSDEYALGLILFELVTLGQAVSGETVTDVVRAAIEARKNPMVPAVEGAIVPTGLVAIVEKATAKSPEDRYPGVAELAADLRRWMRDEEIEARPDTGPQRLMRWMAHHRRATLGIIGGLVLLTLLVTGGMIWRRRVAQEEARLATIRTERFVSDVGRNAETIDAHFLHLQGLLQGLAGAAEQALLYGKPSAERYLTAAEFRDPKRRPPDAFYSKRYGGWVSGESPVWSLPAKAPARAIEELRRLVPLRRMRRRLFIESQGRGTAPDESIRTNELLDRAELPLVWTLIGLPSGLGSVYPGTDHVRPGWDPRTRPWYLLGEKADRPACGAPHQDGFGTGLVFSCSVPLHDAAGKTLGVASVDLALDRTAASLLAMPGHPAVDECFMLDANGGMLVRSRQEARVSFDEKGDVVIEPFPYLTAIPEMRKQPSGVGRVTLAGRDRVVVWRQLESLPLAYAVVADARRLAEGEVTSAPKKRRSFFSFWSPRKR